MSYKENTEQRQGFGDLQPPEGESQSGTTPEPPTTAGLWEPGDHPASSASATGTKTKTPTRTTRSQSEHFLFGR